MTDKKGMFKENHLSKTIEKPSWISDIEVLVWDLDGTLYVSRPQVMSEIKKTNVRLISEAMSLEIKDAQRLYEEMYNRLGSTTQTLITCGVDQSLALSGSWYAETQLRHLEPDPQLEIMFEKLGRFRHIVCTNGTARYTQMKLKKLGLASDTFEKIITAADMFGITKPDLRPFEAVLDHTELRPTEHLFIGDRRETDIDPAKKVGMRTCLVWGESKEADISLPEVYDVVKLLI